MNENPLQVLLVEDNPGDARLIREHLADAGAAGFTVETVQTLACAVERCSRPGVDAVLLDLGLPDCVGLDTLKAVRACAPELPVLVLTGLDDEKTAVQAVLAGAQDYLLKGEIGGAVIPRALRYAVARKRAEAYQEMGQEILQRLNAPGDLPDSIRRVIATVKTRAGFDAVGIRLQDGEDFPYYCQDGFSEDFLRTENTLVGRSAEGGALRDGDGNVRLECTCGLVLSGTIARAIRSSRGRAASGRTTLSDCSTFRPAKTLGFIRATNACFKAMPPWPWCPSATRAGSWGCSTSTTAARDVSPSRPLNSWKESPCTSERR